MKIPEMHQLLSNTNHALKTIAYNSNTVVFSSLSEFYQPIQSKGFAIKYVVEGTEHYTLNNRHYNVGAGSYILCNSTKEGFVEIESKNTVKGICINIDPALMMEVVASTQSPDTGSPDPSLGNFFSSTDFLENSYNAAYTAVGKLMTEFAMTAAKDHFQVPAVNSEFFYTLSEKIIADQLPVFKQLQAIPCVKAAARQELYRRICHGKEFIDHSFTASISIEQVAREACMSEYHFFRLFKQVVGVSPHQYIISKRLELGKELLEKKQMPVSAVAIESGFTDIFSFSKAFRKYFGITPSMLLKK